MPCMEVVGHNNQKPVTCTVLAEYTHPQEDQGCESSHKEYKCEQQGNESLCKCDNPLGDHDTDKDSELDSYSNCQSDDECDDYEADSCVSDDCIEFSDDSTDFSYQGEHNKVTNPKTTSLQNPWLHHHSVHYITLFSEESGYCELQDESDQDDDVTEDVVNEILWRSFEEQALSPQVTKLTVSNQSSQQVPTRLCNNEVRPVSSKAADDTCQEHGHTFTNCSCLVQEPSDNATSKHCVKEKHVSFKSDPELVVIHHIIAWSFAYRAARRGPWEEYARDRDRFTRRIECCASVLEPCLLKKLACLLYTSPSPRDATLSRMPSSA